MYKGDDFMKEIELSPNGVSQAITTLNNQVTTLNTKLLFGTTISNVDLDNYKETGLYFTSGNITHSPTGNYGFMFVVKESATMSRQIYFPQGSNGMYLRRFYNGSWMPWFAGQFIEVT